MVSTSFKGSDEQPLECLHTRLNRIPRTNKKIEQVVQQIL